MAMNRDFKGIWIPKELWLDKELSLQEKIFLIEIDSLDNEDGCYASNAYFADFFNISKTRVTQIITELQKKNLITSELIYVANSKEVDKRILRINRNVCSKFSNGGSKFSNGVYLENCEDNNTIINNTNNNKQLLRNCCKNSSPPTLFQQETKKQKKLKKL